MINRIEYTYDEKLEIEQEFFRGWMEYCKRFMEFPRLLHVPTSLAGVCFDHLLQVEIDFSLQPGTLIFEG